MSTLATLSFGSGGQKLFTPDEVKRLMFMEYERARRYSYPVACLCVAVDRLDSLRGMYGDNSALTIFTAVLEEMKAATRNSDFMGCLIDQRIIALFPYVTEHEATELAERLLEATNGMCFELDGARYSITLSIGMSHSRRERTVSFDTLVKVAEEGQRVADASGGDRVVETELYELYERSLQETRAEVPSLVADARDLSAEELEPEQFEQVASSFTEELVTRALERLESRLGGSDSQADPSALKQETVAREIALREVELQRKVEEEERALAEREATYQREIEKLRRRISKLSDSLGMTEEELKRAYALKSVDAGLSSIYREVQGLSADDDEYEAKRDLMSSIFEANISLQKRSE